jgi:hypothetical protein
LHFLAPSWSHPPDANTLLAPVLLVTFIGTGRSFLAFAELTEATKYITVFAAMCIWPEHFAVFAYGVTALCAVTIGIRVGWGIGGWGEVKPPCDQLGWGK